MKINVILILISIVLAVLIGYLAFDIAEGKENDVLCGIGSIVCFVATLIPAIGVQYESSRMGTNIRLLSAIWFIIFVISHFSFAGFGIKIPYYIVVNGVFLVLHLGLFYKMQGIRDI